ncbi:MAG: hypothetical protein WA761_03620 [Thermoplasmata archaeon]
MEDLRVSSTAPRMRVVVTRAGVSITAIGLGGLATGLLDTVATRSSTVSPLQNLFSIIVVIGAAEVLLGAILWLRWSRANSRAVRSGVGRADGRCSKGRPTNHPPGQ